MIYECKDMSTFFKNIKSILVHLGLNQNIFLAGITADVKKACIETDHENCETYVAATYYRAVDHCI